MALPDVKVEKIPDHYEGDIAEYTDTYLQGRLDEVVDKIETRWGSTVSRRLASGKLKQRLYEAVVIRVAARVFRNPEGFVSEKEGQYDYKLRATTASGTLWFTDDDVEDLTGVKPGAPGLPRTVGMTPRWAW